MLKVVVPQRPQLDTGVSRVPCPMMSLATGACVVFTDLDYQKVRVWFLNLERDLKAACLALGNSNSDCKTGD